MSFAYIAVGVIAKPWLESEVIVGDGGGVTNRVWPRAAWMFLREM